MAVLGNSAISIKFFADILYAKCLLTDDELDSIYEASSTRDLDKIIEKMTTKIADLAEEDD